MDGWVGEKIKNKDQLSLVGAEVEAELSKIGMQEKGRKKRMLHA